MFKYRSTNTYMTPFVATQVFDSCHKCVPNTHKISEDRRLSSFGCSNILTLPQSQQAPITPGGRNKPSHATRISALVFRAAAWILRKVFSRILTSIQFHKGQIEAIKLVQDKSEHKIPIVYVPMHRSHLDYLLISFILYLNNIQPPLVAAGDNLNITFFGRLMRHLGAFFIRRRLDPVNGNKDFAYRDKLRSYMVKNLAAGNSMEFFIEGGRSRTGKALRPKAGLLSVVINAVLDGSCPDAYIVPVGVTYDRLIEGDFNNEQLGATKVKESFFNAVKAIWKTMHSNHGSVRVDFCSPFSLREYLESARLLQRVNSQNSERDSPSRSTSPSELNTTDMSRCTSHYGLDIVFAGDKRQTIKDLAEHITYEAANSSAVMATQAIAFLFSNKFRQGATLSQLASGLDWLKVKLAANKRCLGFTGDSKCAAMYAIKMMGDQVVQAEYLSKDGVLEGSDTNNNPPSSEDHQLIQTSDVAALIDSIADNPDIYSDSIIFKPNLKHPDVLVLNYCSNNVSSCFVTDSIIAIAFESLAKDKIEPNDSNIFYSMETVRGKRIKVPRSDLIDRAIELAELMQMEFIVAKPCQNLEDLIRGRIDSMIHEEYFLADDPPQNLKRMNYYEIDEDDDYDDGFCDHPSFVHYIVLETRESSLEALQVLKNTLSPFIHSYLLVTESLDQLINCPMQEASFLSRIIAENLHLIQENAIQFRYAPAGRKLRLKLIMHRTRMPTSSTSLYVRRKFFLPSYGSSVAGPGKMSRRLTTTRTPAFATNLMRSSNDLSSSLPNKSFTPNYSKLRTSPSHTSGIVPYTATNQSDEINIAARVNSGGLRVSHNPEMSRHDTHDFNLRMYLTAPPARKLLVQVEFELAGCLHGVYFTKYAKEMSKNLGIKGWMRFTRRGTIEGQVEGEKEKIDQMALWLKLQGSPGSKIEECKFKRWQIIDTYSFRDFSIRF
ncbi:Glycerol-3-phosphate acyltransferase 1, mitochondrial [Fragariocoptes setiger]|uniref:Glycerol-3-phosphate acyltransferase 1, mitochondrial n=1 Tax=Fragariocoptes setiger TaxID=1670756 RepID=A0ABQ7S7D6_9ACAR|nr:Glycerol-3-phosphate acyltransferase 1, mitochondrial [Fragariocoptes setiger]